MNKRSILSLACLALLLAGCGDRNKDRKLGQTLASVNGAEITTLQLNEELQRANIGPAQQEQASRQLLQALVDRQLLQSAAAREQLERDPKVMQAVERARAMIVAQAYLQKRIAGQPRPSQAEIERYYNAHPAFFKQRKLLTLNQLIVASADLTPDARAAFEAARSLDEVSAWLDARKLRFARAESLRSTADLAPELSAKLLGKPRGQLFLLHEGERSMLVVVAEAKEAPVSLLVATPQIEQVLYAQRNKEAADAELARLRSAAKIEYLNKSMALDTPSTPAAIPDASADKAALERGVAGLK
ncbi:MAG: EpsD family peptidyl-prolyl cis-trans isomerase [Pseudomonadota bacterium]